jgi:hypothetical protein
VSILGLMGSLATWKVYKFGRRILTKDGAKLAGDRRAVMFEMPRSARAWRNQSASYPVRSSLARGNAASIEAARLAFAQRHDQGEFKPPLVRPIRLGTGPFLKG